MLEVLATSSSTIPPCSSPFHLNPCTFARPFCLILGTRLSFSKKPSISSNLILTQSHESSTFNFTEDSSFAADKHWDFTNEGFEEDDDEGCPWEGAVMYKRDASVSHLEYCTTLEKLGLGKVSSEVSKRGASEMGLLAVKSVKDYPNGTPVCISADVTRKKQKLRLDGIVRTVITLDCTRCGQPAAQNVYSDFSLLLCEEPIQEPDTVNMGVIFAEDKAKAYVLNYEDDDNDEALIDLDDQLYFPPDRKVIDISKNIRDLIHVEITMNGLCHSNCKGMCLRCGANLNISKCACKTQNARDKGYGPLGDLRKKMNQT